jgi:hypothetical protein
VSKTVASGETVILTTSATGSNPITYTWYKEGQQVSNGVDQTSFTIESADIQACGVYKAVVSNTVGEDTSLDAVVTILPAGDTPNSSKIAVAGELYDSSGVPVGPDPRNPVVMNARVCLFVSQSSGTSVYAENFAAEEGNGVSVSGGYFCFRLGEGTTAHDLAAVVRNNPNLFAEVIFDALNAEPDTLRPRIPLTASPFTIR